MIQEIQPINYDTAKEAEKASFFWSQQSVKDRILADLAQAQEDVGPKILNYWKIQHRLEAVLVELLHFDSAVEPTTDCRGRVITKIIFSENLKERETICHGCQKPVKVNLTVLKIELRLLN